MAFDGDILNMIALFEEEMIHMFRKFDPIERYLMCRDDEGLNPYFSITKGQLIDLYYFCTMGKMENDEEQTYPVKENTGDNIIYVPKSEVKKYKSGIVTVDL